MTLVIQIALGVVLGFLALAVLIQYAKPIGIALAVVVLLVVVLVVGRELPDSVIKAFWLSGLTGAVGLFTFRVYTKPNAYSWVHKTGLGFLWLFWLLFVFGGLSEMLTKANN